LCIAQQGDKVTIHLSDTINQTGNETMKTARQQLIEKVEGRSTETLIELAKELNLKTTTEEMIVSCYVERAIEKRLSAKEFVELMESLEAELMTA
jgi:hypothetical protein